MPIRRQKKRKRLPRPVHAKLAAALAFLLCVALTLQGCFDPVYPQMDREARVMEALENRDTRGLPPTPLGAADAVVYALENNLDAKVAEIETAYHNESAVASRRRMLPNLTARYSIDHNNHPSARWSQSTKSGNQSLESSYSSEQNSRQGEIGVMWNLIDFGVGYIRSRQQGERIRYSALQRKRVRQQVVLDVLSNYWRCSAAATIAKEAQSLRRELEVQIESIRDSVEMRILSGAEGARRELAIQGGLAELEQYRRYAIQAKLELGRVMGCGSATNFQLARFPTGMPQLPPLPDGDASVLQVAAIKRRPELYQHDAQERIAVDEARLALLQMAPTANLSLSLYDDPDKFLEWSNWMTVGARVSWNLFSIPARLSERRMAKLQEEVAKQKGLALAAAIMAQVGIAFSDWRLAHDYANTLANRAEARGRLVEALAAGEKDGQTRPGEVLQERVRMLAERAAALRAAAEVRVAGARLANAIGLDVDDCGRLIWQLDDEVLNSGDAGETRLVPETIYFAEEEAQGMFPDQLSGLEVVKEEEFMIPDEYFETEIRTARAPTADARSKESPVAANVSPWSGDREYEYSDYEYAEQEAPVRERKDLGDVVPYSGFRNRTVEHNDAEDVYPEEISAMAAPAPAAEYGTDAPEEAQPAESIGREGVVDAPGASVRPPLEVFDLEDEPAASPAPAAEDVEPAQGEMLAPMAPASAESASGVFPKSAQVRNIPWSSRAKAVRDDMPEARPQEHPGQAPSPFARPAQPHRGTLRPSSPAMVMPPPSRFGVPDDPDRTRALRLLPSVAPEVKALRPPGG